MTSIKCYVTTAQLGELVIAQKDREGKSSITNTRIWPPQGSATLADTFESGSATLADTLAPTGLSHSG